MEDLIQFKQSSRVTWATGDYDAMIRQEGLHEVGAGLVERLGVGAGDRVLDVACGTGNAALPAARTGAEVVGLDLTPEMLQVAARRGADEGVAVEWVEGDAEELPFVDGRFDVVISTFGVQFAPRQEVVASELARVLVPGGRLGLIAWTPQGVIGDFFRTVSAHLPTPPSFVDPPLAWGEQSRVLELFEGTGLNLRFSRETWQIGHDSDRAAVDCYTRTFGPVVEANQMSESNGGGLSDELMALFSRWQEDDGRVSFPAEYLVVTGVKEA